MKALTYIHSRHLAIILFLLLTGTFLTGYSQRQSPVITLNVDKALLPEVLESVKRQSGFTLSYTASELGKITVTGLFVKGSVKDVMQKIKEKTGIEYEIVDNIIAVRAVTRNRLKDADTSSVHLFNGILTDAKTKLPVDEVEVFMLNASSKLMGSTVSDKNGTFTISSKDSVVTLVFSRSGYLGQTIRAAAGKILQIKLTSNSKLISEVVVSARRRVNTQSALLNERKNSAVVSDGISAENIEKTGSITTTQALQRVSGVTVTDDKYVAVRGLGDRSVIGQLNGVRLSSSDPDRSAIPLDLVPANLLDNIVVYKTVTPDKPADAAGGIVELKTRSIPLVQTLSVTAQQGSNTNIGLGGKVNSFYNSDMGFFGEKVNNHNLSQEFKDLSRQYPGGLASIQQLIAGANNDPSVLKEVNRINGVMHELDPVLTTRYKTAPADGVYSISYGNSFKRKGAQQIGIILSASYYNRSTDIYEGTLNQYSIYQGVITGSPYINQPRSIPAHITPNRPRLGKYLSYKENTGVQTLNYGFLSGLAYKFNANHEISIQYLGSKGAETQATNLDGAYNYTSGFSGPIYSTTYSLKQTYRVFNTLNLQGEHKLGSGELAPRITYNAASSKASHNNPDYRFVNLAKYYPAGGGYYQVPDNGSGSGAGGAQYIGTPAHYSLVSGYVTGYGTYGIIQADPNGRRFRNMNEKNYNYKFDLTLPFRFANKIHSFKTGINYLYRERDFSEYQMALPGANTSANKQYPLYLVRGNLDQLVSYSNIGIHPVSSSTTEGAPLVNGFLYNNQRSPNNYTGFYESNAFYAMLDLHPLSKLRVAGGVRFEKTDIESKIDTANVFIDPAITKDNISPVYTNPVSGYRVSYKPYYSVNLTYSLTDEMNFRMAYNTTLARPEIREMTNVFEFDPFQQALVVGNPALVNQNTRSYDLRWEWFPNAGEVISASLFGKTIDNQLEKVFSLNTAGTSATFPEFPTIGFRNNPNRGKVWGLELELVKNLGNLTATLKNFYLGTNISLVQSDVLKNKDRLEADRIIDRQSPKNSPLFEQAPYSINAYLNYANPKSGSDFNINFNMVGERLIQISMDGTPDVYSNPAAMLDLVFSQKLTKRLQLKGYAKNILNSAIEETYNNPGTGGSFYGGKYVRRSYKRGSEWMLGLTYQLF